MLTTSPSLLERLRDPGEPAAWERFVDIYSPLFFSWTKRLGLNGQDAADLVQDVFATLVEHLPRFHYDPAKCFRAWLKTILLNRWRQWRQRKQATIGPDQGLLNFPDPGPPAELEEQEYRQFLVSRAVAIMEVEFQPATWQACWKFVVEGQPAEQVARSLNISVNAVYLAKSRVLRRLRQELHGLLD